MHRIKKYLSLIASNPQLMTLFAKDVLRHGIQSSIRKAKRKANEQKINPLKVLSNFNAVLEKFNFHELRERSPLDQTIDILIPIYNGFEFLEPLFESILKHTHSSYRLIIVNDCSSDVKVDEFLQKFIADNGHAIPIIYLKNEENLGFLQTVNKAAAHSQNHFVLLNTDTEVPPYWLERLMGPILHGDHIATTTPMTNSGTICSFPQWLADNPIYRKLDVALIDRYFSYVSFEKNSISVPTGVGFCMGVNKEVYDTMGMFDEVFGKGYCEENDWCMRALKNGYKNSIVPNLFVYHKHGGSFLSNEKKAFIEKNLKILWKKHPTYNGLIQDLIEKNPLKEMREFLEILITFNASAKNILMIDHELGGGTSIYRDQRIAQSLQQDEKIILVSYNFLFNSFKISFYVSEHEVFSYALSHFDDIEKLHNVIKIDEVFLNSIVSFQDTHEVIDTIMTFVRKSEARLILPIHDFYPICPSYTLLNDKNVYCHLPKDLDVCNRCLENHKGGFRTFNTSRLIMDEWRTKWEEIMNQADTILCFSNSSVQLIQTVYDVKSKINIAPHTIEGLSKVDVPKHTDRGITLAVIGGINLAKGSLIIKEMIALIEKNQLNINIVIIGELDLALHSKYLTVHGKYARNNLPILMASYGVNGCLIPSIWPETFSYTSEEIMMMELPLFVFDIGAPAERVKNYAHGHIIDPIDASAVINEIQKVLTIKL